MKKYIIVMLLIISVQAFGQSQIAKNTNNDIAVFKLYSTQNMWTFIKINTSNGKIWQVQYDIEGDNRFETYINLAPLVVGKEKINGRFILYPTQNIFNFILLDKINGNMWQVQWSMKAENRGIIPIN